MEEGERRMQVIRHGLKWNDEFPKRQTCNKCKCIFLYDKSDIKTVFYENSFAPPPQIAEDYIYCPECGGRITLYN